jgi:hypothetical protein
MNAQPTKVKNVSSYTRNISHSVPSVKRGSTMRSPKDFSSGAHGATVDRYNPSAYIPKISHKFELSQAWAKFLDRPELHWSWYGHFTFEGYPSMEQSSKVWKLFTKKINIAAQGRNFWKRPEDSITYARATEYQSRGSLHYHALLGNIPDKVSHMEFKEVWYDLAGIARIYPYEPHRGAEYYMSKSSYAWKQGEIDLSDTLKFHNNERIIPAR